MIEKANIKRICEGVTKYWTDILRKENRFYFDMAAGKEGGHQLGDKVDQVTTSFLNTQYPTRSGFQHKDGKISTRSMGDIWFKNMKNEWNPINVKTGLVGSEGQPNIVSLKRVMGSILERKIDSYYLLLVKFRIDREMRAIVGHQVYLIDMLDWLEDDVITFNAGPGQMMLKAQKFFDLLTQKHMPHIDTIRQKMELLMDLYLVGEQNLMRDRRNDRKAFKSRFDSFMDNADHFSIDLKSQEEFDIQ